MHTTTLHIYIYIREMDPPPSQSSIEALHNGTPTPRYSTMHIYRREMDSPVNEAEALHTATPTARSRPPVYQAYMPCILLHPLLDLVQCIYIEGRWTPSQLSIDALHTTTPTARSRPPVYQAYMPCILLHPLLDIVQCIYMAGRWTPQSIEHKCLAYHYTHC